MTDRMYAAKAMHAGAATRAHVVVTPDASPAFVGNWSPISLGNPSAQKCRPRRHEVSHP